MNATTPPAGHTPAFPDFHAIAKAETRLDAVRLYAAAGWPIFPVFPGTKQPAIPKWKGGKGVHDATTDPRKLAAWWADNPDYEAGLAVDAAGMMVIDFDPGSDSEALADKYDLPPTLTATTPRGGTHEYYAGHCGNSTGKLAENVDTRGQGGYVLLPLPGNGYRFDLDAEATTTPAKAPDKVIQAIGKPKAKLREMPVSEVEMAIPAIRIFYGVGSYPALPAGPRGGSFAGDRTGVGFSQRTGAGYVGERGRRVRRGWCSKGPKGAGDSVEKPGNVIPSRRRGRGRSAGMAALPAALWLNRILAEKKFERFTGGSWEAAGNTCTLFRVVPQDVVYSILPNTGKRPMSGRLQNTTALERPRIDHSWPGEYVGTLANAYRLFGNRPGTLSPGIPNTTGESHVQNINPCGHRCRHDFFSRLRRRFEQQRRHDTTPGTCFYFQHHNRANLQCGPSCPISQGTY